MPEILCSVVQIIISTNHFSGEKRIQKEISQKCSSDKKDKASKAPDGRGEGVQAPSVQRPAAGPGQAQISAVSTCALRYPQLSNAKSCLESSDSPEYFLNRLG